MKIYLKLKLVFLVVSVLWCGRLKAQVTFVIRTLPAATPTADTLFLAGSANNWDPGSKNYRFVKAAGQPWQLTVPVGAEGGVLEYKITRGSWAKGEALKTGAARPNRQYTFTSAPDTVYLEIEAWHDFFPSAVLAHTSTANVQVLAQEFRMPQLGKSRRVWLYLPPNYSTSNKKYPVLYMHDGQNLFDAFYSYGGEWGVDETLDSLHILQGPEIIVVGIDNGGEERMNEYTPWRNARYGGGKGDGYVDFLVQTLKPYIDAHYRTKRGKAATGIAGSSMGGLISLYAATKYPNVFGRVGVLSPAFWVSPEIYSQVADAKVPKNTKVFLMAGAKEGEQMVPDMARMHQLLLEKGQKPSAVQCMVHADGEHKEWYWRREFAEMVNWLFE